MSDLSAEQIGTFCRYLVPVILTLTLVLLLNTPASIPALGILQPLVAVASVYYWNVHQPEAMPAVAAFGVGLFLDAVSGGPLGLMALVLVLVQWATESQRRIMMGRPFLVEWLGFALTMVVVVLFVWIFALLYYLVLLDPGPVIIQGVVTLMIYPFVAGLFARLQLHLKLVG